MDKHHIEKKDREVVKKFRSAVGEKRLSKQARTRILKASGVLLAAGCLALLVFFIYPAGNNSAPETPGPLKTAAIKSTGPVRSLASAPGRQAATAFPATAAVSAPKTSNAPLPAGDTALRAPTPDITANHKKTTPPGDRMQPDKRIRPKYTKPNDALSGIRIQKIVSCRSVADRQPVALRKTFSLQTDSKAFVWLNVRSEKVPYTLMLVYYINNRKYCEIPLTIRYSRMRTWGYITLNNHKDVGRWHVDVVCKGRTLSQIEFTVVP